MGRQPLAGEATGKLANRARLGVCQMLVMLGEIDTAEPVVQEALAVASEQQDVRHALHLLGDCALMRGDVGTSAQRYVESLRAAVAQGDTVHATFEMQGIAMSMAGQARPFKALRLDAAALAHRKALGVQLTIQFWEELRASYLGSAQQDIGRTAAANARDEGTAMGFADAVQYALDLKRD